MGKFNYNNKIYDEFGNLDFGKRIYLLIRNEDDLKYIYIETVDGQKIYKMPSNNYSLEANQGKSLKQLNERILVEHVLATLKQDISSLNSNVDRIKEIIKDPKMTLLIKGNLSEITVESFEQNKQSMLRCFDDLYGVNKNVIDTPDEKINQTLVMKPLKQDFPELSRLNRFDDEQNKESGLNISEPLPNPLGINEDNLSLNDVDSLLEKKDDLSNTQTSYLEGLQEKLSNELEKERVLEKPKVLVKTNDNNPKKSAFVDVIIVCLGIQLVLFIGLICVMLFIK